MPIKGPATLYRLQYARDLPVFYALFCNRLCSLSPFLQYRGRTYWITTRTGTRSSAEALLAASQWNVRRDADGEPIPKREGNEFLLSSVRRLTSPLSSPAHKSSAPLY